MRRPNGRRKIFYSVSSGIIALYLSATHKQLFKKSLKSVLSVWYLTDKYLYSAEFKASVFLSINPDSKFLNYLLLCAFCYILLKYVE